MVRWVQTTIGRFWVLRGLMTKISRSAKTSWRLTFPDISGRGQALLPASSRRDSVQVEVVGPAETSLGRTAQVSEPAIDRAHLLTSL